MSNGLQLMADALQLGLDLGGRDDMAVGHFAEVELDAGSEEPVERHLIDGHHRLAVDGFRLEMDRRVHMRAVMRGQLDLLDRPALAVGQILTRRPGNNSAKSGAVSALLTYWIFGRMKGGS